MTRIIDPRRRSFAFLYALVLPLIIAACGGDDGGLTDIDPDPSTILDRVTITPLTLELHVGETGQLQASAISQTGTTLNRSISWSSSNTTVASVDSDGLVYALAAGEASITASVEGVNASATVTVLQPGPPPAPSNAAASALSGTEIRLTWTDNSNDEDEFVVYREQGESYVEVARVAADVTEYIDSGLEVGATYRYRVTAINDLGESEPSAYAQATTVLPLAILTDTLPSAVQYNVYLGTLRAEGGTSFAYSWEIVSGTLPQGLTFFSNGTISGRVLEGGSFPLTVRVHSNNDSAEQEVTLNVIVPQADATFDLELVYTVEPSQENRDVFDQASDRWSSIITSGITEQIGGMAQGCRPAQDDYIDDVRIYVTLDSIDGPGGTLGFAGPCQIRFQSGLPISGSMTFDTADVANLRANGNLQSTILHEMGHVLGIGTLWGVFGFIEGECLGDPLYSGARGNQAYMDLGGSGSIPIYGEGAENDGSNCSHWDETTFRNELMTPFLSGGSQPIATFTIAALADFGYQVDETQADPYTLPAGSGSLLLLADSPTDEVHAVTRLLLPDYRRTADGFFVPMRSDDGGDR